MDLEELTLKLLKSGWQHDRIVDELTKHTGSREKAEAVLLEVSEITKIPHGILNKLCSYPETNYSAYTSGLGCRGEGDFLIHHTIAEVIGETGAAVDSIQQDDGGAVKTENGYISAAVDGLHSRLSHFPFLAGFHAARAAIRDVLVMGAQPKAILADVHLANDGDIGKVMDYTAGASTVGELLNVPLIGGSTLRLGGDLVTGNRLSGSIISFGTAEHLKARRLAEPGDVLVMTEGSGGGTITTTALYNGRHEVILETLNVRTILPVMELVSSPLMDNIHAMTDITNGGIRGDAHEFGANAKLKIVIQESKVKELIAPGVLKMLLDLEIDPLGISIDSFLFSINEKNAGDLLDFFDSAGISARVVGRVEKGSGVLLEAEDRPGDLKPMQKLFREAPYTPIKAVADREIINLDDLGRALNNSLGEIKAKKQEIINWIRSNK